ncbi:MAG: toll/interleukin-1 receptor domain-containing protein [Caldimonas sp.]
MAEIFLSYRRQDSQSAAGRLADRLTEHFAPARVFRDHDSIAAGDDFVESIRRSVESSTVLLVVLGPRWLGASDASGRRRLDDAGDFVRLEIELALAAGVAVVPVLVEDAAMPAATELPPSLAEFAHCQAVELSETRWRYDADRLIETLQERFAIESDAAPLAPEPSQIEIGAPARLAADLLDLALHPTRMIARRQTGRASDHARAFGFLAAAIAAGNLALLVGLDIRIAAPASFAATVAGSASWLLVGEIVGLMVAGLLAAVLALAWRVADPGAGYRRVGLVAAYVYGGVWIGFCAGALLLGAAVQLVDPGLLQRVVDALHAATTAAAGAAPLPGLRNLNGVSFAGAAAVLLLLAFAVWLATLVWCVAAWGAFRHAFGATRMRAALATALWLAAIGALLWFGQRLG